MELSNCRQNAAGVGAPRVPRKTASPRLTRLKKEPVYIGPTRVSRRNCNCGHCAICDDNERWERIFREKFADPAYYVDRPLRRDSSLRGW